MRPTILALLVAGTVLASPGWAQPHADAAAVLERPSTVRIVRGNDEFILRRVVSDSLGLFSLGRGASLTSPGLSERIPWSDIDRVQVRTGGFRRGAKFGAAIGAGLGLMLAVANLGNDSSYFSGAIYTAVGVVALSVSFSFVGGGLGLASAGWSTVYERTD
jgi:hypothetical protein